MKKNTKVNARTVVVSVAAVLAAALLGAGIWFCGPLLLHNVSSKEWKSLAATDDSTVLTSSNWMVDLPDSMNLADIRIPGANHAGSKYIEAGLLKKCQDSDIAELLANGYRYLQVSFEEKDGDVVLAYDGHICRSGWLPWAEALTLDSVLADCSRFLKEHPTETVILGIGEGRELPEELEEIYAEQLVTGNLLPDLGTARGKIVVAGELFRAGVSITDLSEGDKNTHKLAAVKNPAFLEDLQQMTDEEKAQIGWIVADFGSEELAWQVYMTNYVE